MISDSSLEANAQALQSLGFEALEHNTFEHPNFDETVEIYLSNANHYCVSIGGSGWKAPLVWNGSRASWDTETNEDIQKDFMSYMT